MFADTRETETVFGPVIQAGLEALKVTSFYSFSKSGKVMQALKFKLKKYKKYIISFKILPFNTVNFGAALFLEFKFLTQVVARTFLIDKSSCCDIFVVNNPEVTSLNTS